MPSTMNEAWVAAAAAALRKNGSWTGRIHIHKLLYLVEQLELADPPFGFVLYQYGPYSFDLDSAIAQMELYGYLHKAFPREGYGAQYTVTSLGLEEARALDTKDHRVLQQVAHAVGNADSQTLELQATCLWVEREEGVGRDSDIVVRVKKLKPRYAESQIREALSTVRSLASTLAVAE